MTNGNNNSGWSHSRIMMLIAAILMFLGGITELGASIAGVTAFAWVFFGLCAWALSAVI